MNKKGFTLVEVIVSLALLSLIGVAVGISLNKIFKNQEVKNYDEYVEKVKSSALLYANNTVDIINKLNSNYSYTVVTIKELVDKGYINKNLTNPLTKEKIKENEQIKIYYNENYEMMVEYPYEDAGEIYLYTMNYNITYKSNETGLCYKGLNGPTLQLVNDQEKEKGKQAGKLSIDKNDIVAYMEDGSYCEDSKIDTSKIGTYKIRYEYTIDGTDVNKSTNKKIAERTITVKPSKPRVDIFSIKYQNENIKDPTFDAYNAILNLQARDEDGLKLKYCLVATGENDTPSVTSCNGTSDTIAENKWIDVKSNIIDIKDKTLNIKMFSKEETENKLKIYVFVKNDFEEHTSNTELNPSGIIYVIRNKLTFIYSYDSNTPSYDNKEYNLEIGEAISNYLSESEITTDDDYHFEGWYTDKNGTGESSNNYSNIYEDLAFYAKWYKYCTNTYIKSTRCSAKCGGGKKINELYDTIKRDKKCREETTNESCNTQACCKAVCTRAGYYGQEACNQNCPGTKYINDGYDGPGCYKC